MARCPLHPCTAAAGKSCSVLELSLTTASKVISGVVRGNVLKALALPHQRPLQNHTALLIPLASLVGELVRPAHLAVAVLAADVSHHVSSRQHNSVLHIAVLQIHNLEVSIQISVPMTVNCFTGYQTQISHLI